MSGHRLVVTVALSLGVLTGCPPEPPKHADPEPLVVGKSPSLPLAVATTKPVTDDGARIARGNAPAIALDSLTTPGKVTLAPGKVVLVHFWATWCEPCKKSFQGLAGLYARYKPSGLEIAAVSVDDESQGIVEFAKKHGGASFPVGWDEHKEIANAYKPSNMPTTYVVDRSGNIAHTHLGYRDGEERELEREIKALF